MQNLIFSTDTFVVNCFQIPFFLLSHAILIFSSLAPCFPCAVPPRSQSQKLSLLINQVRITGGKVKQTIVPGHPPRKCDYRRSVRTGWDESETVRGRRLADDHRDMQRTHNCSKEVQRSVIFPLRPRELFFNIESLAGRKTNKNGENEN